MNKWYHVFRSLSSKYRFLLPFLLPIKRMYWFVNILTHLLYLSQCIVCRRYVGDETHSISDETHNLVKMSPTTIGKVMSEMQSVNQILLSVTFSVTYLWRFLWRIYGILLKFLLGLLSTSDNFYRLSSFLIKPHRVCLYVLNYCVSFSQKIYPNGSKFLSISQKDPFGYCIRIWSDILLWKN